MPIDSVDLEESDSVFVSRPLDILIDAEGGILVSDLALRKVLQYSRTGRLVGEFGRDGGGPGEFVSPSWMAFGGDSLLFVRDIPEFRVEVFDRRTRESRDGRRLEARTFTGLTSAGDSVIVGLLDAETDASYISYGALDTMQMPVRRGRLPYDAHASPMITDAFRLTQIAVRGARVAQAFELSNWLHIFDRESDARDSVKIALARRAGAPVRLLPLLSKNPSLGMRAVNHVSQPVELAWLSDSIVAVVFVDPNRTVSHYSGVTGVSFVDVKNRRSCVDAMLDVPTDPPPAAAFQGDTLVLLYMDATASGRVVTRVRRSLTSLDRCDWTASP